MMPFLIEAEQVKLNNKLIWIMQNKPVIKLINFEIYIADRKATTGIGKAFSAPLC